MKKIGIIQVLSSVYKFHPSLIFAIKTRPYLEWSLLLGSTCWSLALPINMILGCKLLTGTNTLSYYTGSSVPYSQHFIFFINCEWAQ
jgi:hypothetical protein